MTRAFSKPKALSKTAIKAAAKVEVYEATPKSGSIRPKWGPLRAPRWMKHEWSEEKGVVVTSWVPGAFPRPSKDWHREGAIDEIEARENVGQIALF